MKKTLLLAISCILLSANFSLAYSPYGKSYQNNNYNSGYRNNYQDSYQQKPKRVDMYNQYNQYQGSLQRRNNNTVNIYDQYGRHQGQVRAK